MDKAIFEGLNKNELTVLKAALISSSGNGHDFGFVDEIVSEVTGSAGNTLTKHQIGGYISVLAKKKIFWIDGPNKINDEFWIQQFVFEDEIKDQLYENAGEVFQLVEKLSAIEA